MEPVGMTSSGARVSSPRRITEPLPNCFSIWARATLRAWSRSPAMSVHPCPGDVVPSVGAACVGVVFVVGPDARPGHRHLARPAGKAVDDPGPEPPVGTI